MKITEVVLGPGDYQLLPTLDGTYCCCFQKEHYERIEERCWGRLNPDSPISGLCTDLVATCFVFVFHCGANGRTTLCHVVSGTDIAVFNAQMHYVVGEDPCNQVEIVVFRGFLQNISSGESENLKQDHMWLSQTLDRIKTASSNASVHPKPLGYGVVLVEKSSGDVIIPIPPSRANDTPRFLQCFPSPLTLTTLSESKVVDAFYQIQSTASYIASKGTSIPCFEVYDGTCRLAISPSSDDTREIFRIASMHPNFPYFAPIQPSDINIVERVIPTTEMMTYVKGLPTLIQTVGALCEVVGCRKFTTEKPCSSCKGAYYCSKSHQKEDWVNHKA
ncbi:hypothetical protein B0H12DRAFT_1157070 [Mycena haematopus]|nr:hypothetical protein B0H12DRAFT_1157070 [Mycena haematopus]